MSKLLAWVKFLLTDANNQWEVGLFFWYYGVCLFLYKETVATPFDATAFGMGLAGVLGAGAGMQWILNRVK